MFDIRRSAGFTLVETMVAISITAIAGSALLLGVNCSLQTTTQAMEETIAFGMAQQLLDEILGARYAALGVGGHQIVLGPSYYEKNGSGRERYDDVDDYHGLRSQPGLDLWGIDLGTDDGEGDRRHPHFQVPEGFFDNWRQEVNVYYVNQYDPTSRLPFGQTSDYRAVEVRIVCVDPNRGERECAYLRRVVAYVPPL